MPTTLITGANRGIGLALAKVFLANGHDVIATARDPGRADALKATGAECHALDVSDAASVGALAAALKDRAIDYLINNAGIGDKASLADLNFDHFHKVIEVNTLSPLRVIKALQDNVAASEARTIASISSIMGSIDNTDGGYALPYRVSKAALNMALKSATTEMAAKGITLLTLHPGWVQTDMGGEQAPVTPDESAKGLFKVITGAGASDQLRFLDYQGKTLPW